LILHHEHFSLVTNNYSPHTPLLYLTPAYPAPPLTMKHCIQLLAEYIPTDTPQFIYPAYSTHASAIDFSVFTVLLVFHLCVDQ